MRLKGQNALPISLFKHLEKYWEICKNYYEDSEFCLSTFFAITVLEEVGKLHLLAMEDMRRELKGFRNHKEKYDQAMFTLMINDINGLKLREILKITCKNIYNGNKTRLANQLFEIRNDIFYIKENRTIPKIQENMHIQ